VDRQAPAVSPDRDRAADVLLGVCVGLLLAGAVCAALLLGSPAHGASPDPREQGATWQERWAP